MRAHGGEERKSSVITIIIIIYQETGLEHLASAMTE